MHNNDQYILLFKDVIVGLLVVDIDIQLLLLRYTTSECILGS